MSKKILVVDDDKMITSLISFVLKKGGFEVIEINDSRQAVETASAEQPDLILTDLLMPFVGGLELLELLPQQLENTPPIIVLSASGHEKLVMDAFKLGALDYVTKPFSPNELLIRVTKNLNSN